MIVNIVRIVKIQRKAKAIFKSMMVTKIKELRNSDHISKDIPHNIMDLTEILIMELSGEIHTTDISQITTQIQKLLIHSLLR